MRQSIPTAAPSPASLGPRCRRLMITAPGAVELIEEHLLPVGERDVYARTVISGISHGTEIAWLRGEAAALHRRWDADRRFFLDQPGRDFPVAPGYESVARVEQVGPAATAVAVGDLIAVDAPHADGHLLTEQAAVAGRLPAGVDPEQALSTRLPGSLSAVSTTPPSPWGTRWSSSGSARSGCWPHRWPAMQVPG